MEKREAFHGNGALSFHGRLFSQLPQNDGICVNKKTRSIISPDIPDTLLGPMKNVGGRTASWVYFLTHIGSVWKEIIEWFK